MLYLKLRIFHFYCYYVGNSNEYLYGAFLYLGGTQSAFILIRHSHIFTHTHRWGRLPCKALTYSLHVTSVTLFDYLGSPSYLSRKKQFERGSKTDTGPSVETGKPP